MGANSYAANALPFLTAMKQADPMAKIGVPWAFEPTEASGAGVVNSAQWNSTVLTALGANVSFVDTVELPLPAYYGYSLASLLTNSSAPVSSLTTGSSTVLGFQSGQAGSSRPGLTPSFRAPRLPSR
jgi:hypothetical protein